jgi:hypothetical protein
MKHKIKNRWTGAVLFAADVPEGTESGMVARVALEQAVEARADLGDADLGGANLGGANLRGAYLRGAYLRGAYLRGANLGELGNIWGASGNLREIKAIQCDTWPVTYTATHMQIGCQFHELERWWAFTDEQIGRMDSSALAWWQKWKPVLQTIVTMSPAVPGGEKPVPDTD